MGSVVLQVGALELLARYSMNSGRATSVLSSLHEFRTQEVELSGGKQWNWKYLRVSLKRNDQVHNSDHFITMDHKKDKYSYEFLCLIKSEMRIAAQKPQLLI